VYDAEVKPDSGQGDFGIAPVDPDREVRWRGSSRYLDGPRLRLLHGQSLHYLRTRGLGGRLAGPRLLLALCGLITFGLNTTRSIMGGAYGRACFDAIAPSLLIGVSVLGYSGQLVEVEAIAVRGSHA
jgi:hypothetical protein